jgi:hypothetical protein
VHTVWYRPVRAAISKSIEISMYVRPSKASAERFVHRITRGLEKIPNEVIDRV